MDEGFVVLLCSLVYEVNSFVEPTNGCSVGGSEVLLDSPLDEIAESLVSGWEGIEALGHWGTLPPVDSSPELGFATGDDASSASNIAENCEDKIPSAEFLSELNYDRRKI